MRLTVDEKLAENYYLIIEKEPAAAFLFQRV